MATVPKSGAGTASDRGSGSAPSSSKREREAALRQLDRILDALERLNLNGATKMPSRLRGLLEIRGIGAAANPDFTVLIHQVLELQEELLFASLD